MASLLTRPLLRAQSDRRLIVLAREGSEPAFETLVERYRSELLSHCRRLLLPAAAAEDAVQIALLDAWRALERGTEVREPRAWMHTIVHRAALAGLRDSGYDHAELSDALEGGEAPEEDLERRTAVRQALAGLAALPELQREALLRTAVEGQSHTAAAAAMGVEESALRGLVYRGRATLRGAATALTPGPLLAWAADGREVTPLTERLAELVGGGGTVAGGAFLAKAGATVAVTGALAGGGVAVEREISASPPEPVAARTSDPAPAPRPDAASDPASEPPRPVGGSARVAADGATGRDTSSAAGSSPKKSEGSSRGRGQGRGRGRGRSGSGDDSGRKDGPSRGGRGPSGFDDESIDGGDRDESDGDGSKGSRGDEPRQGDDARGDDGRPEGGDGSGRSGKGSDDDEGKTGGGRGKGRDEDDDGERATAPEEPPPSPATPPAEDDRGDGSSGKGKRGKGKGDSKSRSDDD